MKIKEKSTRQKKCELVVQRECASLHIEKIRHVYKVVGLPDDGKSTILKNLIKDLGSDPDVKYIDSASRIERVMSVNDTRAVFEYKGIRIAICTAGDNTGLIVNAFRYAYSVDAEILVLAVRTHKEGKIETAAEFTFASIAARASFVESEFTITGSRIREQRLTCGFVRELTHAIKKNIQCFKEAK